MSLKKGHSREVVSQNVKEMMMSGHPKRQAVAAALASARKYKKMADGGMVDHDLDEEHETDIAEHMIQGDQPPIASPETEDMQKSLAAMLHKASEEKEYMFDGGLVEGMGGDEKPVVMHDGAEDQMSEEMGHAADLGHAVIEGVPELSGLSEDAKKAIAMKKKMRMFR